MMAWTCAVIWLAYNVHEGPRAAGVCLFKAVSGLPCPSCGSTRSVLCLLHGEWSHAWMINPLGYILFAALLIIPSWIIWDWVRRSNTFYTSYMKMESMLKRPSAFIPFICIITINWIWNIAKGL
jgi:hypothetical protein